ncbi:MAG: hypothetical protein ACK55Z_25690, partial [bacterium]
STLYHSGRDVAIGIVVIRDITHTTFTQMRGVHIRDKIIFLSFILKAHQPKHDLHHEFFLYEFLCYTLSIIKKRRHKCTNTYKITIYWGRRE